MEFKIGDKVVVVQPELSGGQIGGYSSGMSRYKGRVFTISGKSRYTKNGYYSYYFVEDEEYVWDERCLALASNKYYAVIYKIQEMKQRREALGYKY